MIKPLELRNSLVFERSQSGPQETQIRSEAPWPLLNTSKTRVHSPLGTANSFPPCLHGPYDRLDEYNLEGRLEGHTAQCNLREEYQALARQHLSRAKCLIGH